jgi:hypothetical protein
MKTGSTAIQDLLTEQRPKLIEYGISFYHVRAKNMEQQLNKIVEHELYSDSEIVLLSSEFFGQVSKKVLDPLLVNFYDFEMHAIFTARRLRDVYPSLYLQNLKGSSMRTSSLKSFLSNQLASDACPNGGRGGQLMNFESLDSRLSGVGFETHWLSYSRKFLLVDFVNLLTTLSHKQLKTIDCVILSPPTGISPRRSLRMETAGLARFINVLTKRNCISHKQRESVMVLLLLFSHFLRLIRPEAPALPSNFADKCDTLDSKINQPFLKSKGLYM